MGVSTPQVLLAGASGLVGNRFLRAVLADQGFSGMIFAPVRRSLVIMDQRLVAMPCDFSSDGCDRLCRAAIAENATAALTCFVSSLGTTIKTAGSKEAFIAVDRDMVLRLATLAYELGARHAIVVSSIGASRQSANFYLRVKGEVETSLVAIGFERVDVLQPSLLLGLRSERRLGEAIAQRLAPVANRLMVGRLRRYRAIAADDVARAMASLIKRFEPGVFVHEFDSIMAQSKLFSEGVIENRLLTHV